MWLGENTFALLPKKDIELMYEMRFTPVRISPAPNTKISKKQLIAFNETQDVLFRTIELEITKGLPKIDLYVYSTYFQTIYFYLNTLKEDYFDGAKEILSRYKKLEGVFELAMKKGVSLAQHVARMIGLLYSDPQNCYYWLSEELVFNYPRPQGNYMLWKVNLEKPITHGFVADKDKRPAAKFGIPMFAVGMVWKKLKPPDKGAFHWKDGLEVFIQAHAIKRLYERMAPIPKMLILYSLYHSFLKPKPFYENNSLLVPYHIDNIVTGYFRADIVDGKILLRTFLFLTNEGTPEARRLKENTGLGKTDISYLNINKTISFMQSDIRRNKRMKEIFTEAGCGGLFDLKLEDPSYTYGKILKLADQMQKHLGMGDDGKGQQTPY